MTAELKNPYISVRYGGILSFGGSQRRSRNRITRRCGCGVIACADLLFYLGAYHLGCGSLAAGEMPVPSDEYESFTNKLKRSYMPLIPRFGTSGFALAWGLNRYFKKHRIRLKARWGVRRSKLRRTIEEMLSKDLPVILSIGNNFPLFWRKKKLKLYIKTDAGFSQTTSTKAHFVSVTGIDDEWLHISSWGQQYYIRWNEYVEFVDRYSSWAISNIVYLKQK